MRHGVEKEDSIVFSGLASNGRSQSSARSTESNIALHIHIALKTFDKAGLNPMEPLAIYSVEAEALQNIRARWVSTQSYGR